MFCYESHIIRENIYFKIILHSYFYFYHVVRNTLLGQTYLIPKKDTVRIMLHFKTKVSSWKLFMKFNRWSLVWAFLSSFLWFLVDNMNSFGQIEIQTIQTQNLNMTSIPKTNFVRWQNGMFYIPSSQSVMFYLPQEVLTIAKKYFSQN